MSSISERLAQLDEQATPGKWHPDWNGRVMTIKQNGPNFYLGEMKHEADAILVATTRSCLPELATLVEAAMDLQTLILDTDQDALTSQQLLNLDAAYKALAEKLGTDHE